MGIELTERARTESLKKTIHPQLVLEIEGVDTLFGAVEIERVIRIGDEGLLIGDDWVIGGLTAVDDQMDVISLDSIGGNRIDQQLRPDLGSVSSVSSVMLSLVDRGGEITRITSPGIVIDDVLGAKAKLYLGFTNTSFPEDYIPVFTGIIDDVEYPPGMVKINIAHPEQLKRQEIFQEVEITLAEPLDNSETTITVTDASGLAVPVNGPDGSPDPAINYYIRIDDEIIQYTGVSGNDITGCTRGALDTVAVAHDDETQGKSLYSLEDSTINCALKIMLSGKNDYWVTGVEISTYEETGPASVVANAVFFSGVDVFREYGVVAGDYATTTGSTTPGNDFTLKEILEVVQTDDGSYVVIDDVTLTQEDGDGATISFRSKYDSLGIGLGMSPDQVDVTEHEFWGQFQLAGFEYRFIIQESVNGKDFLDKEVYLPVGAFSIPRQGRASMGYHASPVLRDDLVTLSKENIKSPDKIKMRRSTNRNFYNTVVYKYDQRPTDDKFLSVRITTDADSRDRIRIGSKVFDVESNGMRSDLNGSGIATRISSNYLTRYKYAAQFFENIPLLFRDGFLVEAGDLVLFDPTDLMIPNLETGTREKPAKLMQVVNKKLDLKTGNVELAIVDPDVDQETRYGAISPSSLVTGGTTTSVGIEESFGEFFTAQEGRKWEEYAGATINVHSWDYSFEEEVTLLGVNPSNEHELLIDPDTPLSAPPSAGYVVDIADYADEPETNAMFKALYAHVGASVEIATGVSGTQFTVGAGDVDEFVEGSPINVHSDDYTDDYEGAEITDFTGTTVTVTPDIGFTPAAGDNANGMNLPDGGKTYKLF